MTQTIKTTFATIVPFFQNEPGLLARAVRSALSQGVDNTVYVVCDCSPWPARAELQAEKLDVHEKVALIELPNNVGAAAARNIALDICEQNTYDGICFLDSDDVWNDNHLSLAADALQNGADMYFSDHIREDWKQTKFQKKIFPPRSHKVDKSATIESWQNTMPESDMAIFQLQNHIIQTSTVVLRRSSLQGTRFPPGFFLLEDDVMWAKLSQNGHSVYFSTETGAILGMGINISLAPIWGNHKSCINTGFLIDSWTRVPRHLKNTAGLYALVASKLRKEKMDLSSQYLASHMTPREKLQVLLKHPSHLRWINEGLFLKALSFLKNQMKTNKSL